MHIPGLRGIPPVTLGKRSVKEFSNDDMPTYAAALSYHGLFALFPFLIFLIALLGFLQIPQFFDWVLEQAQTAMPADAYQRLQEVVTQIEGNRQGGLLSFGIVAALWGAASGVRALMKALNRAYDVEETRATWKLYALSIVFTVGFAVLLIAATALMLLGPQAIEWLADQAGLGGAFVTLWTWLRWPVAVILLMLTTALIYYVTPNVDQPFRFITPGAAIAVIVWILASIGFSIYVSNFANYSATYGSLGGVIVLIFYFYITAMVLLLGAEINAEVYQLKKGDPVPASDDKAPQDAPPR
jgi:membrane protein